MSDKVSIYTTGPKHFNAQAFASGFAGALRLSHIPTTDNIEEAKHNDPDYRNAKMVKITFEVINPDEDAPAHEHLKDQTE